MNTKKREEKRQGELMAKEFVLMTSVGKNTEKYIFNPIPKGYI